MITNDRPRIRPSRTQDQSPLFQDWNDSNRANSQVANVLIFALIIVEHLPRNQIGADQQDQGHCQEVDPRHRGAKPEVKRSEPGFPDQVRHGVPRERIDDRVNDVHQNERADHWERDFPERFVPGCALHLGSLVQLRRYRLNARQENENLYARLAYDLIDAVYGSRQIIDDDFVSARIFHHHRQLEAAQPANDRAACIGVVDRLNQACAVQRHDDTGSENDRQEEDRSR